MMYTLIDSKEKVFPREPHSHYFSKKQLAFSSLTIKDRVSTTRTSIHCRKKDTTFLANDDLSYVLLNASYELLKVTWVFLLIFSNSAKLYRSCAGYNLQNTVTGATPV